MLSSLVQGCVSSLNTVREFIRASRGVHGCAGRAAKAGPRPEAGRTKNGWYEKGSHGGSIVCAEVAPLLAEPGRGRY